MLENVDSIEHLKALLRLRGRQYENKTVSRTLIDSMVYEGWEVEKRNLKTVRLRKNKDSKRLLLDRLWTMAYKMNFSHMTASGESVVVSTNDKQIAMVDHIFLDNEVALIINCFASDILVESSNFQERLGELSRNREIFIDQIRNSFPTEQKRAVALAIFTSNIVLTEYDRERAREAKILLFDENDLDYYETLVDHIGPSAKYQLLADMLPGKKIPGLSIRVPAVRTKMGGTYCYTFSITPDYLLKISYVSHRAKGKASDVNAYQRMVAKSRLKKIKDYISEDGIFPTNIVVNLDTIHGHIQFERVEQRTDNQENGVLGWLDIKPTYKTAWIIDGQHRLFSYSGHERAKSSRLSVLAFEGLTPSTQAQLFVDINAKQKAVKQSLMQELYAELHWESEDPNVRSQAIISKVIQELGKDTGSALYERIKIADATKDHKRCITLESLFAAIEKTGFIVRKNGRKFEYGPFWKDDNTQTLKRMILILKFWLGVVRNNTRDWWDKGSGEGGGLAMNDGVITCINVLRSIVQHLEFDKGEDLHSLSDQDFCKIIERYAIVFGEYLGGFNEEDRKRFRGYRGVQGQVIRTKLSQKAIRDKIPDYNPSGLDQWLVEQKAENNLNAKLILDWIETSLQRILVAELIEQFGPHENEWWVEGIPMQVRTKVSTRKEEDNSSRGGKENYFDLIDYRKIIQHNWSIFADLFSFTNNGNKEAKTAWLSDVNDCRKIVAHPTSGKTVSMEQLARLEEYQRWLVEKTAEYDSLESTYQSAY